MKYRSFSSAARCRGSHSLDSRANCSAQLPPIPGPGCRDSCGPVLVAGGPRLSASRSTCVSAPPGSAAESRRVLHEEVASRKRAVPESNDSGTNRAGHRFRDRVDLHLPADPAQMSADGVEADPHFADHLLVRLARMIGQPAFRSTSHGAVDHGRNRVWTLVSPAGDLSLSIEAPTAFAQA